MNDRLHWARVACAILTAVLLAACGRAAGPTGRPGPTPPAASSPTLPAASLDGTSWRLVAFESAGASAPPAAGTQITLEFDQGKIGGTSGCNSYGGGYTSVGSSITIGEMQQTLMGCEPAVMSQEEQYSAALRGATAFAIAGDQLTIEHPGGRLVFTATP